MKTTVLKLCSIIACAILLYSCSTEIANDKKKVIKYLKVEKMIMEYINENPNWKQNDIIQQKSCDSLAQKIVPLIADNLYEDLPFVFEKIQEYEENGVKGYLALFNFDGDKFEDDRVANGFLLSIFGIVDESMLKELKNGESYFIRGKLLEIKSKFYMMTPSALEEAKMVGDILLPNVRMKIEKVTAIGK